MQSLMCSILQNRVTIQPMRHSDEPSRARCTMSKDDQEIIGKLCLLSLEAIALDRNKHQSRIADAYSALHDRECDQKIADEEGHAIRKEQTPQCHQLPIRECNHQRKGLIGRQWTTCRLKQGWLKQLPGASCQTQGHPLKHRTGVLVVVIQVHRYLSSSITTSDQCITSVWSKHQWPEWLHLVHGEGSLAQWSSSCVILHLQL